ncbi:MAG: beta-ketoacyl-[acyl-carrier-protein] synthase family protein [Candidatus Contendobacter sp.]|nr:beta-ketoacyl-[acyl-carrier-protein] synthase family protein [Candidatus Contendobacter sp.]MDG4556552.1 beta-ketoacyl-[acyl-carrier-protein] synthase family protein [Candidatus Contendobacter sp.]
MKPLAMAACTLTNALGRGLAASRRALRDGESGLRPCDFEDAALNTWIGRVAGLEEEPLRGAFAPFDCRNNRLARLSLEQDHFGETVRQASDRYGPDRIGVFVGTSTSGIGATERAYRQRDPITGSLPATFDYRHTHNVFSVADFTRRWLDLTGVAIAISTACSSSAKAFASAWRQMRAGFCDAAVVGGVDSLCLTTLHGFNALGLTSTQPCRPWDVDRDGLNVGEGAGFTLLEWAEPGDDRVLLLGYGESSDAYHMTAAHPEGTGAALAMQQALARADVAPDQVDYVNLHGTATPLNDAAEDRAVLRVFGPDTPCSSTKGWTGHTLGAAGVTEAIFVLLCLEQGLLPGTLNTRRRDPRLGAGIVLENRKRPLRLALSNSFGFGGTNCSLLFGRGVHESACR